MHENLTVHLQTTHPIHNCAPRHELSLAHRSGNAEKKYLRYSARKKKIIIDYCICAEEEECEEWEKRRNEDEEEKRREEKKHLDARMCDLFSIEPEFSCSSPRPLFQCTVYAAAVIHKVAHMSIFDQCWSTAKARLKLHRRQTFYTRHYTYILLCRRPKCRHCRHAVCHQPSTSISLSTTNYQHYITYAHVLLTWRRYDGSTLIPPTIAAARFSRNNTSCRSLRRLYRAYIIFQQRGASFEKPYI